LGQKIEIFENLQKVTETTQGCQLTIFRPWDAVLVGIGHDPQLPAVFEKIAILGSKMATWFFRGKSPNCRFSKKSRIARTRWGVVGREICNKYAPKVALSNTTNGLG
jgi:hypothetical protein